MDGLTVDEARALALMKKQLAALREIFRVTELTRITGEADKAELEAPDYSFLIEKRGRMFAAVRSAEERITALLAGIEPGPRFSAEAGRIASERDACARRIIGMDETHLTRAASLKEALLARIRGVKAGASVFMAYGGASGGLGREYT
ncbi:MAG: hypothetical protein LBK41_09490 [Clostridiales bacterium]|jgi:hypothetical protein|nr:hypothetical protein [Clostridiales bacterium]